jgi:biopolymer transport protein ExbB
MIAFMRNHLVVFLVTLWVGVGVVDAQQPDPADGSAAPEAAAAVGEQASPQGALGGIAKQIADRASKEQAIQLLGLLKQGGILMIPLAGLSFVAVLLIIYYMLSIRQGTVVSDKFMNAADALIRKQDYLGLIAVCNRENEAIARITYKTLDFATKNPTASFEEVREVTEAEGSRQASILNQRITYLADVGSIAPMVGLLGTVTGLIRTFNELNAVQAQAQGLMSQGVAEALITTATGLFIGIPALMFYSIFRGRVQKLISEMEAAMTHLMALLAAQYKRATYRASARPETGDPSVRPPQSPGSGRRKEGAI